MITFSYYMIVLFYYCLREFVLNSRHPGPRREKWGWERRPLRHFGGIRGLRRMNTDEFREAIFYAQAHANRHICSELGVHSFV